MTGSLEDDYAGAGFDGHLPFGSSPALLIVDVVMAYLDPASPLYAGVEAELASNERLVAAARAAGVPVIFTNVVYEPGLLDGGMFARKVPALKAFERGIPAGRIYRAEEMLDDPHFAAREALVDVPHPRWPGLKMQNVFPRLSRTPGAIRSIAPQSVGQDNAAVYGELGLSPADIAGLAERKAI